MTTRAIQRGLKLAALQTGRALGIFSAFHHSAYRARRLLITCYHGISIADEHMYRPWLFMTEEQFVSRLDLARDRGYTIVGLQEGLDRLFSGRLDRPYLVLTFDDGGHNFYRRAFPVLNAAKIPATVYLTTYYCEHQLPVFNVALEYVLFKGAGRRFDGREFTGDAGVFDLGTALGRAGARRELLAAATTMAAQEKDELATRVAARIGIDYGAIKEQRIFHIMSPREVIDIARRGIDVQLHTHRHRSPDSHAAMADEIRRNREIIETLTKRPAVHLCYPSGVWHPQQLPLLEALGVASATTCESGLATPSDVPLLLPRVLDFGPWSRLEFESWLCGVGVLVRRPSWLRSGDTG